MRSEEKSFPHFQVATQEDDPAQHLMLDPRPREVMNRMVLEAMQKTSLRYRITLAVLSQSVSVFLFGALGNMIVTSIRLRHCPSHFSTRVIGSF